MGKASRNPTKKPYKQRVALKRQEIEEEQAVSPAPPLHPHPCAALSAPPPLAQEEDRFCWNLVIGCLVSVVICFVGEYIHKRCALAAPSPVSRAAGS